jgi:ribonuclease HII
VCVNIGIDEAGRGPWTGSVFAAAVVLNPNCPIIGLNDSKKLSTKKRETLAVVIAKDALAYGIGSASAVEIDKINILQATFLAMRRALACLPLQYRTQLCHAWVDGNRDPNLGIPTTTLIQGDASMPSISAASILAKIARDNEAAYMHSQYPEYGFNQHKGYGTVLHRKQLQLLGPTPYHRKSFSPVAQWYLNNQK